MGVLGLFDVDMFVFEAMCLDLFWFVDCGHHMSGQGG